MMLSVAECSRVRVMQHSDFVRIVARWYGIEYMQLIGQRRTKIVSRARQMAMAIERRLTDLSLEEIGDRYDRDHTTVIYACEVVHARGGIPPELLNLCSTTVVTMTENEKDRALV